MRDLGVWRPWTAVLLVGGVLFVGCDKGTESAGAAASAAPVAPREPTPSPDPNATAGTIRQFYPVDCDASAAWWKWATCHDETKGFDALLACTKAARDQTKAAAARLPLTTTPSPDTPCAVSVEAQSRKFVTNTATYLDDVVTWLTTHKAALVGPLRASTIQDVDNDKLKADMPKDYDEKYGGDSAKGESLRFGWVNDLACTKSLFRCGTEDDPSHKLTYIECGVHAAAVHLGVDCGTSSPYQHTNGKPYCVAAICDMTNPRTWLYDRSTGERIP
jgi:hypothetical protein